MSSARVLTIDTSAQFQLALEEAAVLLRAGAVVAIPTETVYGLAANALDAGAVERIFSIKGRPAHNPVIVHVEGREMGRACAADWPPIAEALAQQFWPGPLTIVLGRSDRIPDVVTAKGPTVGLRWPAHPFVQALVRTCGFPLAAPSANPAGQLSPTTAEHVQCHLGTRIPLIVDGGPTRVGIESTVVDVTVFPPRILRPGIIGLSAIEKVTSGVADRSVSVSQQATAEQRPVNPVDVLRSPGMLEKHYAPRARLVIWSWKDETELRQKAEASHVPLEKIHLLARRFVSQPLSFGRIDLLPEGMSDFARVLYDRLHQSDEAGAELIIVEAPPATPEWEPIWDRLRRAAV